MKTFHKIFIFAYLTFVMFVGAFGTTKALTLSTAKIEISADPGETLSPEIFISTEQQAATFYTSAENFAAGDESGTPYFTKDGGDLASWIDIAPSFDLEKGEQKAVKFKIRVPRDAAPGGHFAAVFFSTASDAPGQGQVSVAARLGVLILLHVSGLIKEGGGVIDSGLSLDEKFYSSIPVPFFYRYQNSGNDRFVPGGVVTIKNILGWTKASLPINPSKSSVLPNSTRRIDAAWGNPEDAKMPRGFFGSAYYELTHFAFGGYRIQLAINQGSLPPYQASYLVFVIPWQLLLVVLVVLPACVLLLIQGLKRYNRRLITKARRP